MNLSSSLRLSSTHRRKPPLRKAWRARPFRHRATIIPSSLAEFRRHSCMFRRALVCMKLTCLERIRRKSQR
ncbi:hypothetical protein PIB30_010200 [Stylosanthes scabra]|uniref:Uncharacterized protein n=1 Tax=Stylosanthes scabra TaxID=79078 RepID=A0ABU6R6E9_9FABA|nr:hypothetical protein [Stylosanthes scabra]